MLVQYSKPKAIITCTFCKKPDHDAQRCWDIAENQLASFRGVAPTSNSGEKGSRSGNCQQQVQEQRAKQE
jgi:hypothetical protein